MAARKYELGRLVTYAYCSMQYHLRYDLKLPWGPVTAEAGFAIVLRESFREFFRCLTVPALRLRANEYGRSVMNSGMDIFSRSFPKAMTVHRRGEYATAVGAFIDTVYVFHRDRAIGFDIPRTVHVESGDDTISVDGTLDFAFWQMAGQATESAVAVTIVGKDDPLEDLVNLEPLRIGFAISSVLDGKSHDVMAQHKSFPVFDRKITRPGTSRQRLLAFERTVRAIDRGIVNRVFIPQSSPEKCAHCPFKTVCNASLVDEDQISTRTNVSDPFAGWPKRKT